MMASVALGVAAWCFAGTASAADDLASPSSFNRTVYGISPDLRFSGDVAELGNHNAPMRSDNRDPTQWTISIDLASCSPLRSKFNGTGIELVLHRPAQENASSFPLQVSLVTATDLSWLEVCDEERYSFVNEVNKPCGAIVRDRVSKGRALLVCSGVSYVISFHSQARGRLPR